MQVGFDLQTTRFLLDAKGAGVDFSDALTLGRQNLHIDYKTYCREAARFGQPADEAAFADHPFAEGLLRTFGATNPSSLDAAAFEGATHIADLNKPLPKVLVGLFSVVIDGGTLEHVFDFRQAAINVGKLLRVGGHLVSITCANNFLGHGFYQFSPELFYRVFAPENGFEVESMILTEAHKDGDWYEVVDGAKVGARVILVNGSSTYMMMRARKIADVPMFRKTPQQSDYESLRWQEEASVEEGAELYHIGRVSRLAQKLPRPARTVLRRLNKAVSDHFESPHFKKVRSF